MNTSFQEPQDLVADENFWINTECKQEDDLKDALIGRLKKEGTADGFSLPQANLRGIYLVNQGSPDGFKIINSDLYKADFRDSKLFNTCFAGSSLMKANFSGADLHCADLESCNLLGTNFSDANLENINWGKEILQEQQAKAARKEGNYEKMRDLVQQAEEIYRHLHMETEKQGLYENAGFFFRKEMTMRRLRMKLFSLPRLISKVVDLICGYGEKPSNLLKFSLSIILLCACCYFLLGINQNNVSLALSDKFDSKQNLYNFFSCLYFSVVTFTTLGYGDLTPVGATRVMAALEAFSGSFTMALFVVVFVKKMTR